MFTGLIREIGEVKSFQDTLLCVKTSYKPSLGDSIAINGACLTAVRLDKDSFCVELSDETKSHIACENLKGKVHIEPAMRLDERLDGHIVQGHIDAIGTISAIKKVGSSLDFSIKLPKQSLALMMPKGSVAVDGVSLTVNEVLSSSIRLTIIPHTFKHTLFESYEVGRRVNIESDLFARYIFNMLNKKPSTSWDDIDKIMSLY